MVEAQLHGVAGHLDCGQRVGEVSISSGRRTTRRLSCGTCKGSETRLSSGILVEQEEDLSANCGENLTSVHGQPRCCAPLREHPASSLFLT